MPMSPLVPLGCAAQTAALSWVEPMLSLPAHVGSPRARVAYCVAVPTSFLFRLAALLHI